MASAVVLALASSSVALAHTISDRVLTLENGEVYTYVTDGKTIDKVNGVGATLTLKTRLPVEGSGAGIYIGDGALRDVDINVKKLTVINESNIDSSALGSAIYITSKNTLTVDAEHVELYANRRTGLFVNANGQANFKNVKVFKAVADQDRALRAPSGSINIEAAASGADIDVGVVEAGVSDNTLAGKITINNLNGTNKIEELKVFGKATANLAGDTTINKPVDLKGDLKIAGNLNLAQGQNNIASLQANQARMLFANMETKASIGKVTGDLTVAATGELNDALKGKVSGLVGEEKSLVSFSQGSENVNVVMAEGLEVGEITAKLDKDGNVVNVVEKTNSVQSAVLDLAGAAPVSMVRILTNDVRKRLGDIRSAQGTHGAWVRYDGGKLTGDSNYENKFHTVQIGIDTIPEAEAPRFGVAMSYTKGDSEFARGESDMDAFSLATYSTWMADSGLFADVIGRMATVKNDMTVGQYKGDSSSMVLGLSGEMGWRFNLAETLYIEPQAEVAYTYVTGDKFELGYAEYDMDSTNSLTAQAGFAAGIKCPANKGDLYVRVSGVHEFLGDTSISVGNHAPVEADGKDTWVEFGIGGNFNLTKSTYIYADVERTEGAKLEEDWRANVGVRYSF